MVSPQVQPSVKGQYYQYHFFKNLFNIDIYFYIEVRTAQLTLYLCYGRSHNFSKHGYKFSILPQTVANQYDLVF